MRNDSVPGSRSHPIHVVHRLGAGLVGAFVVVFGVLGLVQAVPLFATVGAPVMGLSTNGALSGVSVVVGGVLVAAALRGGRTASTISIVTGAAFVISGLVNGFMVGGPMNMLAFTVSNVVFSVLVGLALLILGSWGRLTGNLPTGSPYRADPPAATGRGSEAPDPVAAAELAAAERARARHETDPGDVDRLREVDRHRSTSDRERAWRDSDPRHG